jgi:hypothetical protein
LGSSDSTGSGSHSGDVDVSDESVLMVLVVLVILVVLIVLVEAIERWDYSVFTHI